MNKKFSTLLVGALLTSSVGAFATVVTTAVNSVGHNIDLRPTATASEALTAANEVSTISESLLYQLTDGQGNVLIQDRNYTTGELTLKMVAVADAPINASLWTIKASDDATSGKNFVYVNKETGFELAIDLAHTTAATADQAQAALDALTASTDEGCTTTWAWYATDALLTGDTFQPAPVYSYFKNAAGVDMVVVLEKQTNGNLVAVQYPKTVAGSNGVGNISLAIKLQPVTAASIVLTADDLNRVVDYKYLATNAAMGVPASTVFTVESSTVPTTASVFLNELTAEAPTAAEVAALAVYDATKLGINAKNAVADYVYLKSGADYMYVSENFFPANSKFLELALMANGAKLDGTNIPAAPAAAGMTAETWMARSLFKVTYMPSEGTLKFEPLNALSANPANNQWVNADYAFNTVNNNIASFFVGGTPTALNDDKVGAVVIRIGNLTATESVITAYNTEIGTAGLPGSFLTQFTFKDRNFDYLQRATLDAGLYFIKNATSEKNLVCNFEGTMMYDAVDRYSDGTAGQNYNDMPATMWVFSTTGCTTVKTENREYGAYAPAFTAPAFAGQLYQDAAGKYFTINKNYIGIDAQELNNEESYMIDGVTDTDALTSKNHGYQNLTNLLISKYNLAYNLFVNQDLYLDVDGTNNFAPSENNDTYFEAEEVVMADGTKPATDVQFGVGAGVAGLPQLVRTAYTLKVYDTNLIDNDKYYVYLVEEVGQNPYYLAMTEGEAITKSATASVRKAVFYLKADQVKGADKYYVLIDINTAGIKTADLTLTTANGNVQAHCIDGVGRLSYVTLNNIASQRASAFHIASTPVALYRTITSNKTANLYMQRGTAKEYLYEDCNNALNAPAANIVKDFGYLNYTSQGVQQKGEDNTTAMYVQYINHSNAIMPQYLFLVDKDSVADGKWCEVPGNAGHGYIQPGDAHSDHTTAYTGYMSGRFLINLTDSVEDANHNMMQNADKFKWGGYTRLGFVEGVYRIEGGVEYLYLVQPGTSLAELSSQWGVIAPETFANSALLKKVTLDGTHSLYAFSLRLINENDEKDFLIESKGLGSAIGSFIGSWVKEFNNTLVVLSYDATSGNHQGTTGTIQELINNAQVFNVEEGLDEVATGNGAIDEQVSPIAVTTGVGTVTIAGAQGKKVTISNSLGQNVATTVLTSDNAVITVPAGFVIVSVEGAEAVKAVVE